MNNLQPPDMEENKRQYLQFIQDIITRMNSNSFAMKSWMIAIVTGIFAISWDKNSYYILVLSGFPVLLFWALDAYYLQQERKFRGLYNEAISESAPPTYSMDISAFKKGKYSYWKTFISKTIWPIYVMTVVFITLYILAAIELPFDLCIGATK